MADSLYSRLGGYDGIAMFATTLVGQAQKDELLARFWANRGEDRIARECQLLIDYLVKETGGQMYYTGRDMALSHQGMGITEADWTRFIEIVTNDSIENALIDCNAAEREDSHEGRQSNHRYVHIFPH